MRWVTLIVVGLLFTGCVLPCVPSPSETQAPLPTPSAMPAATQAAANPFPGLEPITWQNIDRLKIIGSLGIGHIYGAAVSPDKQLVAVYTTSGVFLYDSQTLEQKYFFQDRVRMPPDWDSEKTLPIVFSPDGKQLVYGNGEVIYFWDLATRQLKNWFSSRIPGWYVSKIDFAPGGDRMVITTIGGFAPCDGFGVNMALYDLKGNMLFDRYWCRHYTDYYYRFTEDGKVYFFFLSIMTQILPLELHVVDLATGSLLESADYAGDFSYDYDPRTIDFDPSKFFYDVSPDGKVLASAYYEETGRSTRLIDASTRKVIQTVDGLIEFAFSEDGELIWRPKETNWTYIEKLENYPCNISREHTIDHVKSLFSLDHVAMYLISHLGQIQGLELWDLSTCEKKRDVSFPAASKAIFSPNGDLLATHNGFSAYLWDLKTSQIRLSVDGVLFTGPVDVFAFNTDGSRFLTSAYGRDYIHPDQPYRKYTISVWNSQSGDKLLDINPPGEFLKQIAATPDKDIILAQDSLGLNFWDLTTGNLLATIPTGLYAFDKVNNNIWVAVEEDNDRYAVTLFDYRTGQTLMRLIGVCGHSGGIQINAASSRLAFKTNRRGAGRDTLTAVDMQSGLNLWTVTLDWRSPLLKGLGGDTYTIDLWHGEFEIWGYEQDQPLFRLPGEMLYSDGALIFSHQESIVQIWDARTGQFISQFDTKEYKSDFDRDGCLPTWQDFEDISFDPQGRFIAIVNADGLICLSAVQRP